MKQFLTLILVVGVILCLAVITLEGIPVQESNEKPQKIKIMLDVAGENDLLPLVTKNLLEAFKKVGNINVVMEIEDGVSYVVSVVLVEARAGANKQKTNNIAACVQFIEYFDNDILKRDVAASNWERVNDLTQNLIEHSQTGLHLFSKDDLGKMTDGVVSKFQKQYLENNKEKETTK